MREQFREKAGSHRVPALVVPVNRLSRFIGKRRPAGNRKRELVGEIQVFFWMRAVSGLSKVVGRLPRRTLRYLTWHLTRMPRKEKERRHK
jgi:hypothetical protein